LAGTEATGKRGGSMTYNDNTTRNTIDGRGIGMTNWDFRYINNRHSRAVSNATLPSTYQEFYSVPKQRVGFGAVVLAWSVVIVLLYVATFEVGLFDDLYLWIIS
jgi:hypothetical protein